MKTCELICNKDCLNCPYDDCINDELDAEDYAAARELEREYINTATPEQRKQRAKNKAYYEANREEIAAKRKAYYEANREEIAAKRKAYYEANREELVAYQKAYREAKKERIRNAC